MALYKTVLWSTAGSGEEVVSESALSNRALKRREGSPAAPCVSVHHLYTPGPLQQPRLLGKSSLHPCPIIAVAGCKVKTGVRLLDIRGTFKKGSTEGEELAQKIPIVTHLLPLFINTNDSRDSAAYTIFITWLIKTGFSFILIIIKKLNGKKIQDGKRNGHI